MISRTRKMWEMGSYTVNFICYSRSDSVDSKAVFKPVSFSRACEIMMEWRECQSSLFFRSLWCYHAEKRKCMGAICPLKRERFSPWRRPFLQELINRGDTLKCAICNSMNKNPEDKVHPKHRMLPEPGPRPKHHRVSTQMWKHLAPLKTYNLVSSR